MDVETKLQALPSPGPPSLRNMGELIQCGSCWVCPWLLAFRHPLESVSVQVLAQSSLQVPLLCGRLVLPPFTPYSVLV